VLLTILFVNIEIMLTAFTAALLLITISELGDKTFFIAVILSLKNDRKLVFIGVVAALATMTVLSVCVGRIFSFLPQIYIHYAEIVLFALFGFKLLYDASKMPKGAGVSDEQEEALEVVEKAENQFPKRKSKWGVLLEAFVLTFVAEWGDRTQIATIALATFHNPVGVIIGGIVGHTICTAIAVLGGKLIQGKISERTITAIGGFLFLIFSAVALFEGVRITAA
jgi:putative Ca2+/H+ antiporter (TMEM165/GDT1 family)